MGTPCHGCANLYWKQGGPSTPKHSCKVHEKHMWVPEWCVCKDRVDEKEALYGARVESLRLLYRLASLRMCVKCRIHHQMPASVAINMSGATILQQFRRGMFVYTPVKYRKNKENDR